jgi:hypothetical protein
MYPQQPALASERMYPIRRMRWAILFTGTIAFAATAPPEVTYHKDIEPIFQRRCQECHRPGEIAPFSMRSYTEVRPWAKAIRTDVLAKKMPPWLADSQYGHFANDRSLSKQEIDTITAWVDQGAKEGDASQAPVPRKFPERWNIPTPDLVISMREPFQVPANGEVSYQYIVMPTGLTEDTWVQMAEARPSEPSVVHHIVVFIRSPQSKWLRDVAPGIAYVPPGNGKDFNNTSGGGSDILLVYTPGMIPEIWRPGLAKLVKAGSDLVFQVHYTPNGKPASDLSKIGLVLAKEKPAERALTLSAYKLDFRIPPQDPNYRVDAKAMLPNGGEILSLFPHVHLRGRAFEYRAVYPDGTSEILLRVPRYDFYWQLDYKLATPVKLPPGSRMECSAWYDNSPNNPRNPDPTAEIRFGEQSREEMMFGFFDVVIPAEMTTQEFLRPRPKTQ